MALTPDEREERLDALRRRRDLLLNARGLRPFDTGANPDAETRWLLHARQQGAANSDDHMVELLDRYLDGTDPRPRVRSTEALSQPVRDFVERRIAQSTRLGDLHSAVLVDEFPTGDFNAQVSRELDGFIVYINAGTRILFAHFAAAALRRGSERLTDTDARFLGDLIESYVGGGDLFTLPAPVPPELTSFMLAGALDRALQTFCIAHEYGHILAGHLDDQHHATPIPELIAKSHAQEFEADRLAAVILFGDSWPDIDGIDVFDRIRSGTHAPDDIRTATELSAAISAPPVFFAIAHLIEAAQATLDCAPQVPSTHPPPPTRAAALTQMPATTLDPRARSWWPFAADLRHLADERFPPPGPGPHRP
ncbi:MAG: hypothetical protein GY701_01540 [Sulfitobacter sp.]|nr:hypothetical protein [Sulfitobacter sp.]